MSLGERIKELRESKGISQAMLAESIGVSNVMISMYEQNKKKPSLPTLEKLADYFVVSIDNLLGRETVTESDSAIGRKIKVMFHKAERFTEEEQDAITRHFEDTIDIYLKAKGL